MYKWRFSALFLLCFMAAAVVSAKDFFKDKPNFIEDNLKKNSYSIDTAASAVMLYEKDEYILNSNVLTRKVRRIVKILKRTGKAAANAEIELYNSPTYKSSIKKIKGTTYNLENGAVTTQELETDNIFKETYDNRRLKKFSLPSVREGSVIDYSFETEETLTRKFCTWHIDGELPKLYTELALNFWPSYNIVSVEHNSVHFWENTDNLADSLMPDAYKYLTPSPANIVDLHWVRKNVTAAIEEPFVADAATGEEIQFFIKNTNWDKEDPFYTWERIDEYLMHSPVFNKAISSGSDKVETKAKALSDGLHDKKSIAQKIFYFVRDSITRYGDNSIFAPHNSPAVLENRTGSVAEINFLLISMLRDADIDCDPVILSTRENGRPSEVFPDIQRFNYTICRAEIDGQKYLLDASQRYTPFGVLPENCYNGYARVIKKTGESLMLEPDEAKEKDFIKVATLDSSADHYTVSLTLIYGDYNSAALRRKWNNDTAEIKKYITASLKKMPLDLHLIKYVVHNLSFTGNALSLYITASAKWQDAGTLYLSPYFMPYFERNPFKAAARKYPVAFPYLYDVSYDCELQLPPGYRLEDTAQLTNTRIALDNKYDVKYDETESYTAIDRTIHLNSRTMISRALFLPEDYPALKEFFTKMITAQEKSLVIKKIQ